MILQLDNIEKSYGDNRVLHGITKKIASSAIIALLGSSGSGKSTLLHIIGTLDKATKGIITINGTVINDKINVDKIRNEYIGFIFQKHYLLPELSVYENITIPARIAGKYDAGIEKYAHDIMDIMGIRHLADRQPINLSGGESQRVAIARALINKPALILADEPTGNLDKKNREEIYNLIKKVHDTYGTTFVIATHDDGISQIASQVWRIEDGRIN